MNKNFSNLFMRSLFMRLCQKGLTPMTRCMKPLITLIALSVFAVSGCAMGTTKQLETATQPRALGVGVVLNSCIFLCFATNTQTDSEGNGSQSVQAVETNSIDFKAGVNTNGNPGR